MIPSFYITALILLAQFDSDPILQFSFESAGHINKYVITQKMLEKSPSWTNSDNPPLSLKSVEIIATNYALKSFADKNLKVTSILVRRIALVDRWYFEVQMETSSFTDKLGNTYEVVVLMDGTVVEPIKAN